ncbi:helix-turn-helix domain-containing protein [Kaarinaea lacus]
MNNIQTFHFQSHDFDEISASLSRWDQTYHQLSAGAFFGDVDYVQINGMEIFELHWEQVIHYQGLTPPGTIGFGLPKNVTGESRYLNRPINNNELLIQHCGTEGDLIGSQNFIIQVLTINEQRFFDKVASITGIDNRQQLCRINRIPLTPVFAVTLRSKFHELIQHTFQLNSATNNQFSFVTALSEELLHLIANIVISGNLEHTTTRLDRQRQLVKKAEEYVWSYPTVSPRIDTLSANIGTSERSLRDAFKACTGMSAGAYLKTFRLNQVRSELKSCSTTNIRVQDVAFEWGFSHMGQFAADYKLLFGESPSETLRHSNQFRLANP